MTTTWLIDKSALVRLPRATASDDWFNRAERGLLHVTMVTLLEVGYSARSETDWRSVIEGPPVDQLPVQNLTPEAEARALEVQKMLSERGRHRAPGPADLIIAATAEVAGLTVLHMDKDFELIAEVTGQPVERLTGDFG